MVPVSVTYQPGSVGRSEIINNIYFLNFCYFNTDTGITGDDNVSRFCLSGKLITKLVFSRYATQGLCEFDFVHGVCPQSRLLAEFHNCFFVCHHRFGQIIGTNTKYFKMWYVSLQAQILETVCSKTTVNIALEHYL